MGYTQQDFKHLCSAMKFFRARSKRFALELEGARLLGDSGFIFLGTMASDIAAMGRLEACLQKEPDQGLTIRIESGAQYIDEQMTGHLRGKQKGFLGAKKTLSSLSARVYALGVMTLKVKLDEYKDAVSTHEGLDSLRARFLAFITEIEKFEQRATSERIRQVTTPAPSVHKPDRKFERRLRDQEIRTRMKGATSGGGKKQKAGR